MMKRLWADMRQKITNMPLVGPLLADQRGNTLMLITAGIVPVVAAIGGGVDISRAYMTKARLQQAVDSASLAGSKAMGYDDLAAGEAQANKFIDFNFPEGSYGSGPVTTSVRQGEPGEMCVEASTTLPTVVMKIFGYESFTLAADACARKGSDVNTDIVLVLDVTGSMKEVVGNKQKITAMKEAVLKLYDTLENARTQMAAQGLRLRIGIVPYANTVNVGMLLFDENANYIETTAHNYYSLSEVKKTAGNWVRNSNIPYGPASINVAGFVNAGLANRNRTKAYAWKGCIEERATVNTITVNSPRDSIPAGALDLVDSEPTADPNTRWRPYLATPGDDGNRYGRPSAAAGADIIASFGTAGGAATNGTVPPTLSRNSQGNWVDATAARDSDYQASAEAVGPNIYCPHEAKPLSELSKADLDAYLTKLQPAGSTLHDIGMGWGIRLISRGAPFVNPEEWNGRPIDRHIIFMTDGIMADSVYSSWGLEAKDRRIGGGTSGTDTVNARHTARFEILCEQAKREGISIWTVAFATGTVNSLKKCASNSDQAYVVADSAKLVEKFAEIGQNIGSLRLSK